MNEFPPSLPDAAWTATKTIRDIQARELREHTEGLARLNALLGRWADDGVLSGDQLRTVLELLPVPLPEDEEWSAMALAVYEWCHDGTFTVDQVRAVCEAYNGEPCTHDHKVPERFRPMEGE